MAKKLDLPKLEEEIQGYWEKNGVYRSVIESRRTGKKFYFLQGPPFTSGKAHLGHAWNHALKDMVIRYKTMQGFDVLRRAGWDMHGLPIEVKVEELVLKTRSKKDIEEYGVENFISECKKFAIRNMNQMTLQLRRLGVWLDWDDPYMTLDRRYMEGVWFFVKKAHEKDLLYLDEQVIHWCPRCETGMAGYEVRDEYQEVEDMSIYIKAKLKGRDESILVWTTTPWTLPANIAIAVHPDFRYVKVEQDGEQLILVKERLDALKGEYKVLGEFTGSELESYTYEPFLDIPIQKDIEHRIVMAPELVVLEEGTGCVHIAPGHGEEDFAVGKEHNLQFLSPVDEAGKFTMEPYKGIYIRDANPTIIEKLEKTGKLYKQTKVSHRYPHCWRCKTPLILRSTKQWFLAVSKIRDNLIEKNKEIEWVPEWIGSGRFDNWLKNARDWCISRQRYWNTPLPVWKCDCGNMEVIGSIKELAEKSVSEIDEEKIDLHRPAVDEITLKCEKCDKEMKRVPDVMDVWIDSGSASWANLKYPCDREMFEKYFPADFITEGSDQTRGWFYSLLVCSAIAFDRIPYKRVLYHGFTLDAEGRKMSKSLNNVVDPLDVIKNHGADAFRFYMLWISVPWEDLKFSMDGIETIDKMFNILWNVYSFADTYMKLDKYDNSRDYKVELGIEDRWLLSKFNSLVRDVTKGLDKTHPHEVCRPIYDFILEMSRWYVKVVRDRVWIEGNNPRKIAVYQTLYEVLTGLCRLMAPIAPHIAEHVYRDITGKKSVHLTDWPAADESLIDEELEKEMTVAQQIFESVAAARQKAGIKLRWPIRRVVVSPKGELNLDAVEGIVLKMCNAKKLETKSVEMDVAVKPNLKVLGPKYTKDMGAIMKALKTAEAGKIEKTVEAGKEYVLELKGKKIGLKKDDVIFEKKVSEDIVAEEFDGGIVYIDSKIDKELYSEAMARELIRRIQEMRKEMNLNELESIDVFVECSGEFARYLKGHEQHIDNETRGKVSYAKPKGFAKEWKIEDYKVTVGIERKK